MECHSFTTLRRISQSLVAFQLVIQWPPIDWGQKQILSRHAQVIYLCSWLALNSFHSCTYQLDSWLLHSINRDTIWLLLVTWVSVFDQLVDDSTVCAKDMDVNNNKRQDDSKKTSVIPTSRIKVTAVLIILKVEKSWTTITALCTQPVNFLYVTFTVSCFNFFSVQFSGTSTVSPFCIV